jgi:hypothetical protein
LLEDADAAFGICVLPLASIAFGYFDAEAALGGGVVVAQ